MAPARIAAIAHVSPALRVLSVPVAVLVLAATWYSAILLRRDRLGAPPDMRSPLGAFAHWRRAAAPGDDGRAWGPSSERFEDPE